MAKKITQRERILRALQEAAPEGLTDYELRDKLDIPRDSITSQRWLLVQDGMVAEAGRRRTPGKPGQAPKVWAVTGRKEPLKKKLIRITGTRRNPLRRCPSCKKYRPTEEFTGRRQNCDWCHADAVDRTRERQQVNAKRYREKPEIREKERAYSREWRARNKEHVKEYNRRYHAAHR